MLYNPTAFQENSTETIHDFLHAQGRGLFITHGQHGLQSTFLPFVLYRGEGSQGVIRAHMARGNAHWEELGENSRCLLAVLGENGYVSPSWYATKAETGKVVPTWNYEMVEARGVAVAIDNPVWLLRLLNDLTDLHEGRRPEPWHVADAPAEFIEAHMRGIVGIEMTIDLLEGKWKMSQNKSHEDRQGVAAGFANKDDPHHNDTLARLSGPGHQAT